MEGEEDVRGLPDHGDDGGVLQLARDRQPDLREEAEEADGHHVRDVDRVGRELEVAEGRGRDHRLHGARQAEGEQDRGIVNVCKNVNNRKSRPA